MSFINMLNDGKVQEAHKENVEISKKAIIKEEKEKKPEEILRGAGIKIKMVTPTSFGTQIDFAKRYDEDEIKEILKNFSVKIKNKSVFIVD